MKPVYLSELTIAILMFPKSVSCTQSDLPNDSIRLELLAQLMVIRYRQASLYTITFILQNNQISKLQDQCQMMALVVVLVFPLDQLDWTALN